LFLAIIWMAAVVLMVAAAWALFAKAGQAGWKSLVPIYGAVVFMRIVGRPWWWVLWLCVPLLNLIPAVVLCWDLARVFGKGTGWAVGIALLGFVFVPMLAFGAAEYQGPLAGAASGPIRKAA
jgi:hypothetical protein